MDNNEKQFEYFVSNIKFDDTPEPDHRDKLEQNLLNAMAKQPRQIKFWRIIMKSRITKLATAAAVVIIGLIFLVSDGQNTLYANAVKALEQARTFHIIIKEYRDGKLFKDHEIWYDREAGIVEEERYEGRTDMRIDNGQYEWRFASGKEFIVQLESYQDNDAFARQCCAEWLRYDPNRVSSGDMVIDGVPCDMYVLSDSGAKVSIWIDGKNYVRQIEQSTELSGQKVESRASVEYDIAIDQNRFSPKFGQDVKVINPREWIEELYSLDTAIFTRKCLGFVFAVHELKTCENGLKYIVCSTRLSDQTRRDIGTGHPWTYYGQSDLFDRYDETYSYDHPILLGELTHDGVRINWYLLLPSDDRVRQSPGCDVDVRVNTANQLEEKCKAEGLPTNDKFRLNITMQESKEHQVSLREIIRQVYSFGEKLDPIVHSFLLTQVITKADGKKTQAWRRPAIQLSEEEYNEGVERRVQEWLELMGLNKLQK
ncbi:MAG: hypothetical protein FVQ84_16190 [Planctomycetes bacterium]|nr:hypothetical protein [Planctomycetota bacterium]